jgi:hypothetical protein
MRRERIGPAVGYTVLYGIAFAACAVADQLVDGLRPCLDHFVLPPPGFFFCILTRGNNWVFFVDDPDRKARIQPWPSDDLVHYALLAVLALVIVGIRFASLVCVALARVPARPSILSSLSGFS